MVLTTVLALNCVTLRMQGLVLGGIQVCSLLVGFVEDTLVLEVTRALNSHYSRGRCCAPVKPGPNRKSRSLQRRSAFEAEVRVVEMTESGAQVSREAITMATGVRRDCVTAEDSWRGLTSSSVSAALCSIRGSSLSEGHRTSSVSRPWRTRAR